MAILKTVQGFITESCCRKKYISETKDLAGRVFFVLGIFDKIYGKIGFWKQMDMVNYFDKILRHQQARESMFLMRLLTSLQVQWANMILQHFIVLIINPIPKSFCLNYRKISLFTMKKKLVLIVLIWYNFNPNNTYFGDRWTIHNKRKTLSNCSIITCLIWKFEPLNKSLLH